MHTLRLSCKKSSVTFIDDQKRQDFPSYMLEVNISSRNPENVKGVMVSKKMNSKKQLHSRYQSTK